MKNEPELIDIYAVFALLALMQKPVKGRSEVELAYQAFEQAQAMLTVRDEFVWRNDD
jgi:hypothetical protein